jgi:hypothetical protein
MMSTDGYRFMIVGGASVGVYPRFLGPCSPTRLENCCHVLRCAHAVVAVNLGMLEYCGQRSSDIRI